MDYRDYIAERIDVAGVSQEEIKEAIAVPPDSAMGDYALPCFKFAKALRQSPVAIAQALSKSIQPDGVIQEVQALNGYLNFKLNRCGLAGETLGRIAREGECYGGSDLGARRAICLDYSSVNIAKPFHIGHLSTTVIGGALYRIFNFLGYRAVGINHLGDYGTQFGKMISAYRRWGNREMVEEGGIRALNDLYVRFHREAETSPELEDEARAYFKKIEEGDAECTALFTWFKELTLKEVGKIYDRLGIVFDSYAGESFYQDKMQPVVDELREKGLLQESRGAQVVDLEAYGMPPCIILKSDGTSLYATRDIAAAIYRKQTYDFERCLYVVAYQQNLHFRQVFQVLELMGREWAKDLVHVAYGMVSLEDGAMATRKGNVVFLQDVLDKCVGKAYRIISEKNPELEEKQEVAEKVGVGAVVFGALYNNKIKDIVFSYDKALNFDGETSVYVQYACVRARSVLAKAEAEGLKDSLVSAFKDGGVYSGELGDEEYALVRALSDFPETVQAAADKYEPSFIARFCVDTAQKFNQFYFGCKILQAEPSVRNFRLALTEATAVTLQNALKLLGIGIPEKM